MLVQTSVGVLLEVQLQPLMQLYITVTSDYKAKTCGLYTKVLFICFQRENGPQNSNRGGVIVRVIILYESDKDNYIIFKQGHADRQTSVYCLYTDYWSTLPFSSLF